MPRPLSPLNDGRTLVYLAHIEFPGPNGLIELLKPGITWDHIDRRMTYKADAEAVAKRAGISVGCGEISMGYFCAVAFSGFMHADLARAVESLVVGACRCMGLKPFGGPWREWFHTDPGTEGQIRDFLIGYTQQQIWDAEPLFYWFYDEAAQRPYHHVALGPIEITKIEYDGQVLTPAGPVAANAARRRLSPNGM